MVVTGIGAVTPLGNDVRTTWECMKAGRSGIRRITLFDPSRVDAKIGGEVRDFDAEAVMPRKEIRRNDRYIHYAWAATTEALADAGIANPIGDEELSERTGAIIGSGIGGINTMIRDIIEAHELGVERVGPFLVTAMIADMAPGYVAIYANARGPNYCTISACASSNHAIGDALNIIRRGDADVMIAGGSEAAITPMGVGGFGALRALSTRNEEPERASRPFDKDRDGFVVGEGSGVLILEEYEMARTRGARIYAELVGYGMSADAYHITAPSEDGDGPLRVMGKAIKSAGIDASQINYINAHGTSTPHGDKVETLAIRRCFGECARKVAVSSTKSMTGHLLGAAGGLEAGITALAVHHQTAPPTINLENPDEDCDLDYVPNKARRFPIEYALSNSFGFGGTNAALVFKRFTG